MRAVWPGTARSATTTLCMSWFSDCTDVGLASARARSRKDGCAAIAGALGVALRVCHRVWEVCYGEGYRGRPSPDQWQLRHIHPPRGEVMSVLEPNAVGMCVVTVGMWCEGDGSKRRAF